MDKEEINKLQSKVNRWELRARKAEQKCVDLQRRIKDLENELNNVLLLHKHKPSEMKIRIEKVLNLSD